ncbi:MAG: YraN family protein [Anaerolineae bacterium]
MKKHNQTLGQWGEQIARNYLQAIGYKVLGYNLHTPYGEIDIVARHGEIMIFVEVKTRASSHLGLPEEAITPRKREHMLAAAEYYAAEEGIDHWRIDVIAIEGTPGKHPKVTHFENAL